MEANKMKAIY
jgi:hypothetical protein